MCLAALSAIVGTGYWMGVEIVQQAGELRETVTAQVQRLMSWLSAKGVMHSNAQLSDLGTQALGSLGRGTAGVDSVLGALHRLELGRAPCGERVCKAVWISVVE